MIGFPAVTGKMPREFEESCNERQRSEVSAQFLCKVALQLREVLHESSQNVDLS